MDWWEMGFWDRVWWFLSPKRREFWAWKHKTIVQNAFVAEHGLTDVMVFGAKDGDVGWRRIQPLFPPISRGMKKLMGMPLTPGEELSELEAHEVSRALAEKRRAGVRVVTYVKGSITPEGRSGFEVELKRFGLEVIWLEYAEGVADPGVGKL